MRAQLDQLADLITDAVVGATCTVQAVAVTGGRPAAPSSEGIECQTVIYVYGDNITDFNQTRTDACNVRARLAMTYEIWTCYPEDWYDQVLTDAADDAADCLYELMSLVWCALVDAKDAGDPFGSCEYVELAPLAIQGRFGGAVSAVGGVVVPYDCADVASPASP